MKGMPGVCRKCRRPVTWNGVYWAERNQSKHHCKENA